MGEFQVASVFRSRCVATLYSKHQFTREPNNLDADRRPGIESKNPEGYAGYGYTVWNRITTAASSLTVNVNLSWAANIVTQSGEGMSNRHIPHILCMR